MDNKLPQRTLGTASGQAALGNELRTALHLVRPRPESALSTV
jgi:hypothetical protein